VHSAVFEIGKAVLLDFRSKGSGICDREGKASHGEHIFLGLRHHDCMFEIPRFGTRIQKVGFWDLGGVLCDVPVAFPIPVLSIPKPCLYSQHSAFQTPAFCIPLFALCIPSIPGMLRVLLYPSSQSQKPNLGCALHAPMPFPCPMCPNVIPHLTVGTLQSKLNRHPIDNVTYCGIVQSSA